MYIISNSIRSRVARASREGTKESFCNNNVRTTLERQKKLTVVAVDKHRLQCVTMKQKLMIARLQMLAERYCAEARVTPPDSGGPNADQYNAVFTALQQDDLATAYYKKSLSPRAAEAATAMQVVALSNMRSYIKTGSRQGFRYDAYCFASAIEIFSDMSKNAYIKLRDIHPNLPHPRYLRSVVNRHQHQPSGVLRGDIRDWSRFVFQDSGLTAEEKLSASLSSTLHSMP